MTSSHMKQIVCGCIFLLTSVAFFSSDLLAQQQTVTASQENGYYYTVQKGDTLWDISQKFFSDPWLWPDLWAQNQELTNPHWIYPGDVLHIYLRGGKVHVEKVEKPTSPSVQAPEPGEPPYFMYNPIQQVGFIRNPAVSPAGVVFKIQGDKKIASTGDIIYIRQEGGGRLVVGGLFTLYRTFGPVQDPMNKKVTVGTQHYFTGVAEVTRLENGYALAKIIHSYRTTEIDDRAMPYVERSPKIYLADSTPEISGTILRSEDRTNIFGEHTVVFIDKGKRNGVAPGQQYQVYRQEKMLLNAKDKEPTLLPTEQLGTLLVLRTEPGTATMLVLTSKVEFGPGTKFATTLK